MNPKLKFALIRRYSDHGFAMPIAMALGFIMILIAATMIMRSQGDQLTASAQKATTDSLNVAETGVTRVQSLLNRLPKMAEKPKSDWVAEYNRLSGINNCLSNTQDDNLISNINNWITLDSSDPNKGEIKILDYTYANGVGKLKIAGRARSENGSVNSSVDNADSYLEVQIPVVTLNDPSIPGLWAKTFDMGNNDVSGNVLVAGCSVPSSGISTDNIITGSGTLSANPSLEYPALPNLPSSPIVISGGITSTDIPNSKGCIYDNDGYVLDENGVRVSTATTTCTNSLEVKIGKFTLPRASDTADASGVYHYLIGKNSQGNSISLKGGEKLEITAGQKVRFYLQGNINMGGQSQIIHNGSPPTNFQIYGSDGGTHYRIAGDTNTYTTTSIMLSGNTSANMFIYAPEATVGVNGGGNVPSTITGSVWAKGWNGSSANQLIITQSAAWTDLPLEKPKRIGTINSWQRASN